VEAGSLVGKDAILCCDMGLGVGFSRRNTDFGFMSPAAQSWAGLLESGMDTKLPEGQVASITW